MHTLQQSENNEKLGKSSMKWDFWQGFPLLAWEWTSPPSYPSLTLWVSITVVFKWHIQINLSDKWKALWDMSGHGDGYVANVAINHPCFSWDHARLIHGYLWFSWQRGERIALSLKRWVRQIVAVSIGPKSYNVTQELHSSLVWLPHSKGWHLVTKQKWELSNPTTWFVIQVSLAMTNSISIGPQPRGPPIPIHWWRDSANDCTIDDNHYL